ncbi:MAG: hypothetical protein EOL88_02545 [Bacteroidia bacterium]|nr:hypothetical protein [Bacteroidia bacterium]
MARTPDEIITGMYNDLKRYAHSPNASPKTVATKEYFIDEIKEAFTKQEAWIEQLEADIDRLMLELSRAKQTIMKLEAVCFIHGIDNLPVYMAKNLGALVDDVRFNEKFNLTQIPDRLLENKEWRAFFDEQSKKLLNGDH